MSAKKNDLVSEIQSKKNELEELYLKKMKKELKQTHLIKAKKIEIAKLLTKFNQKESF